MPQISKIIKIVGKNRKNSPYCYSKVLLVLDGVALGHVDYFTRLGEAVKQKLFVFCFVCEKMGFSLLRQHFLLVKKSAISICYVGFFKRLCGNNEHVAKNHHNKEQLYVSFDQNYVKKFNNITTHILFFLNK